MEKNKSTKIISIIALIVAVIGLSLGFAAFSRVLTIQSSATVNPSSSDFVVKFSTSDSEQKDGQVTGSGNGATAEAATISGTQITGLKAKFTKPGQSVTYSFYARNESDYNAYLKSINIANAGSGSTTISCSAISDASPTLVQAACKGIHVTVTVGEGSGKQGIATDNSNDSIDGHLLAKKTGSEPVVVKIEYNGTDVADGDFNVTIGDITLNYSTQDS